jgi:spermidine synthase
VTAGSFVQYPEVERIVICEIEPSVLEASAQFSDENRAVLSDPRTQVIYDDARHFLATTDEQFDVITSDPIHPWVRGAASLYSVEYHELVKARLRPGGVVAQWVPLYETDMASAKSQIGTFVRSFPDATLWNSDYLDAGYDLILVGQAGPTRLEGEAIARRLSGDAALYQSLSEVGLGSTVELLQTYAGRGSDLEPWLRDAEINRDRSLRLQYLAGLALDFQDAYNIYATIVGYRRYPRDVFLVSPADEARLQQGY